MKEFEFIDLFAGVGGFHQAMEDLGGKCVFASEIDIEASKIYEQNYGLNPLNDITVQNVEDIPNHDVLCAGFPCQSFSKAGQRKGMEEARGTLFFDIARILEYHKTEYIILENVRNLVSHDKGNTWRVIKKTLKELGYRLTENPLIISPHQIGVPQLRERVYILGKYDPKKVEIPLEINLPELMKKEENSIYDILVENENSIYEITDYEKKVLSVWDDFYQNVKEITIGFPIWVEYLDTKDEKILENYPTWKKQIIKRNWNLYENNKVFIDLWMKKNNRLEEFIPSHRKFEWQAGGTIDSVWQGVIQFRPSGVRVKRPDTFPALVAMVQTPIVGRYSRKISLEECKKLQSFNPKFICHENHSLAYKQFGNSVNVEVVKTVSKKLFEI